MNENAEAHEDKPLWLGHRKRLRQRIDREGWESLKPYEMVEVILFYAVPRQDVTEVSRALLARFGTVGGVFRATKESLRSVKGVTESMAEWIAITGRLMQAYYGYHAPTDMRLICYQDVLSFLTPIVEKLTEAPTWVIYTDFDFNLMALKPVKCANDWWDAVNVRWMVRETVTAGAKYVFLFRREADSSWKNGEYSTRLEAIANTLRAAEIELMDCILICNDGFHSMNVEGMMKSIRMESGNMALHERYVEDRNSDRPT